MERAYEIRIYPNAAQRELIERTFGCCRWVYNRCLETRKAEYERTGRSPSACQLQKLVTAWKRTDAPWLAEADSHALQQAAVNIAREGARLLNKANGTAGLAGTGDAKASQTLAEQAQDQLPPQGGGRPSASKRESPGFGRGSVK